MKKGISIIICCYNSEWIIERCLNALVKQKTRNISWEIIIVNNASTDKTYQIAENYFKQVLINHKIVNEPKPGLLHARKKGVKEAQYSYLIFCDDDNLLSENYIFKMYQIMEKNPIVGACGGFGIPEFQKEPNQIIYDHLPAYALGSQKRSINFLYGAGLCIRKDITEHIYETQQFYLSGRCGNKLLAGDDSELVKSIILNGYQSTYRDDITFIHVLKKNRLSYEYLCNMYKGFGMSYPIIYIYDMCINNIPFHKIYFLYLSTFKHLIINMPFFHKKKNKISYIHRLGTFQTLCSKKYSFCKLKEIYKQLQTLKTNAKQHKFSHKHIINF